MRKLKPALVAHEVVDGTSTAIDDFKSGVIKNETTMTDRLFGSVAQSLNGRRIGNLKWKAYSLTSGRGKAGEETRHGADILGVLHIDLPDIQVKKGFLLQAKKAEPGTPLVKTEWERFQAQCKLMLERSPVSFGVIYSREAGVIFIPAQTILEIGRDQLFDAGSRSLYGFFKSHVKCEIGDRRLSNPSIEVLDRLSQSARPDLSDFGADTVFAAKVSNA